MWTFNADDYAKQVLSPAVATFTNEGKVPDYFQRYNLPLDISDKDEIAKAIRAVTNFLNKRKQHPRDKQLVSVLLARKEQQEARRVLLDPEARLALRAVVEAERKKLREAQYEALDKSIGVVSGKGYLTPNECSVLVARFCTDGLSETEIKTRIRVPIREVSSSLPTDQGLPKAICSQIRSNLAVLKKGDLYEFLDVRSNVSKAELARRYRKVEEEWRPRPANFHKTAAGDLLGIIKTHMIDGDRSRYDTAREWEIVQELRFEVELAGADKRIDRDEFKHLLKVAADLGLSDEKATDYIISLAQDPKIGAAVEWAIAEESIRCANCAAAIPKNGHPQRCTVCGAELWITCPKCKNRSLASDAACGSCGFRTSDLPRVRFLSRKAMLALEDGRLDDALQSAREAERLWGRHGELDTLLHSIEIRVREIEDLVKQVEQALAARQLFSARDLASMLHTTSPDRTLSDGRDVVALVQDLDGQLRRVEDCLARGRSHERDHREKEAVFAYQDALAIASDVQDAIQALARIPPKPVSRVSATVSARHVTIQWTPSPAVGEIRYAVVRSENRPATTRDEGTVVARTRSTSSMDEGVEAGALVFYTVFTERGGTPSRAVSSPGILVTREIQGLMIQTADAVVTGTWEPLARGRPRIFRAEEISTGKLSERTEIPLSGPAAFTDRDVKNGCTYYYHVRVQYIGAENKPVLTDGQVKVACPDMPPAPVESLKIQIANGAHHLSWEPPGRGVVSVYRSSSRPPWPSGTSLPIATLAALGSPLPTRSDSQVVDTSSPVGVVYYVPVTVAGETAIVGEVRRYATLPDVMNLQVEDFDRYLLLKWEWPPGCAVARVAWREDDYPVDGGDPRATIQQTTRAEYDRLGGYRIEDPARAPHRFVVFATMRFDGEMMESPGIDPGARKEVRTVSPVKVSYGLTRGILRRNHIKMTLSAEEDISELPEIVLVAKRGTLQPIRSADGTVLERLSGISLGANSRQSYNVSLGSLRPPLYLRAFFIDPESNRRFHLADPPPAQMKVT